MIEKSRTRRVWPVAALTLAALVALSATAAAQPPGKGKKRPIDVLESAWPGHPEWAAMLVDILAGSELGPGEGWFRKAVAGTRFDWRSVSARLDRDRDGTIAPEEFPGPAADFARLDRDRDGALTAADFDFSAHALTPTPAAVLFYRLDRDGDGKVTPAEFDTFFKAADRDGAGFLALSDLQELLTPPARRPPTKGQPARPPGPSKLTLVRGLYRQEIGSLRPGPALDAPAPDFTLKTFDGRSEVTLSKQVGPKPVVLVFGNFTCGPFRNQAGNVEKLYRRYRDRATFLMVYVREAHPTDGWQMESNDRVGVSLRQPRDYAERAGVAQVCSRTLGLGMPLLVDTMDDRVGASYSGMPSRLYLIDGRGKVAYKSGRGPFGFKPAELEHSLLLLLDEPSQPSTAEDAG